MKTADYSRLLTEQPNPRSRGLDRLTPLGIISLMNAEDRHVVAAVTAAKPQIAKAAEKIAEAFRKGSRLILAGAGTSGRLAVIEAAECPPTFNSGSTVQAIMAGGKSAVFKSKEGAEDSETEARRAVRRRVRAGDVLVGIAASGVTSFVRAALTEAKRRRAFTILVTCHVDKKRHTSADIVIALRVGPEVLSGSTRLKSGTACKMALNMLTTASMVQIGKVYDHWMVDLQPKSRKLVARGLRLIQNLGGVNERRARVLFRQADGRVKVAILMAKNRLSYRQATQRLRNAHGFLREALTNHAQT